MKSISQHFYKHAIRMVMLSREYKHGLCGTACFIASFKVPSFNEFSLSTTSEYRTRASACVVAVDLMPEIFPWLRLT